jgi:hypothetical protein
LRCVGMHVAWVRREVHRDGGGGIDVRWVRL